MLHCDPDLLALQGVAALAAVQELAERLDLKSGGTGGLRHLMNQLGDQLGTR